MKKIIAIAAIIATAQASAFWNDNGNTNHTGNGSFDTAGSGEAEATFSMNFSGRGKSDFRGNGVLDNQYNWAQYDGYYPYYGGAPYGMPAPVAPAQAPAVAK